MIDYLLNDLDQKVKCKELHVRYEVINGSMGISQPWSISHDGLTFSVKQFDVPDEQKGVRNISVVSNSETEAHTVISSFHMFEQLLMLFEGRFLPLCDVEFIGSDEQTVALSKWYKERRPHYFQSADFTRCLGNLRLNPSLYITKQLFEKWIKILDKADIMHKMFLVTLSKNIFGNDMRVAFLVESTNALCKIFPKLIKNQTNTPGIQCIPRSLKQRTDKLIAAYGEDIFARQRLNICQSVTKYEAFLDKAINSRNRIMHEKTDQNKPFFSRIENVLYIIEFSFLYRRIMFELLDIPYNNYSYTLKQAVEAWETWYDKNK